MPTYPQNTGTATANSVFGTTAAAAQDLSAQIVNSFSTNYTAEKLEIRGNNGGIIGVWHFNATKTGTFEILELSSGGISDLPGDQMSLSIDGTTATVLIDNVAVNRVNNDTVKRTFNWTYYPGVTLA